jgi:hypothetical protein
MDDNGGRWWRKKGCEHNRQGYESAPYQAGLTLEYMDHDLIVLWHNW